MEQDVPSWIPFHIVACSSEEIKGHWDLAKKDSFWISNPSGSFPIEIILRLHFRVELKHLLIKCL